MIEISLITWNINGIRSLLDVNSITNKLDIIKRINPTYLLLQETRTGKVELIQQLANILNYKHYYYLISKKTNNASLMLS